MATVLQHLTAAYRKIGVVQEGEQPNAEQTADGIATLSSMLAGWEGRGVPTGLSTVTLAAGDTLPLPATHDEAVQTNLAMRLAPEYGAAVHPLLVEQADQSFRDLQAQYADMIPMSVEPAMLRAGRLGWWGHTDG